MMKANTLVLAVRLSLMSSLAVFGLLNGVPVQSVAQPHTAEQLRSPPAVSSSGEALDIRDFGARCDGVTDDYAAIAAALALAGRKAGTTVNFAASQLPCMLSSSLTVPDNVTLRAEARSVTLKAAYSDNSRPLLLQVGNNVSIYGLSFDGGGKDMPNAANLIEGYRVSNVTFDHIAIRHSHGMGLLMSSNIVDSVVRNSTFEDLGNRWKTTHLAKDRVQGVVFCCGTGNHGNVATDNNYSDIGLDALQFSDQSDVTIRGNRFKLENSERMIVTAPDYPAAIFIMRIDRGTISNNLIEGAQGNGIDALALTDTVISHNIVAKCGAAGICLFDSFTYGDHKVNTDHVILSENALKNNGQWAATPHPGGITLGGSSTDVTLTGNIVTDSQQIKTQKYGVYGHPGATLTNLAIDTSNRLDGNAVSAIGGTVPATSRTGNAN